MNAAFSHLYGLNRKDTAYVLDTFPIVRKHEDKATIRQNHLSPLN